MTRQISINERGPGGGQNTNLEKTIKRLMEIGDCKNNKENKIDYVKLKNVKEKAQAQWHNRCRLELGQLLTAPKILIS